MFDGAASMELNQLNSIAHYLRLALNWRYTPDDLRSYPILAGLSGEPTPEEQQIACEWLEEIQRKEGRPINELDYETIQSYIDQVISLWHDRWIAKGSKYTPEESQQLLEKLRRAVPSPAEENWMKWRKAG
jgi:hypothetical protein